MSQFTKQENEADAHLTKNIKLLGAQSQNNLRPSNSKPAKLNHLVLHHLNSNDFGGNLYKFKLKLNRWNKLTHINKNKRIAVSFRAKPRHLTLPNKKMKQTPTLQRTSGCLGRSFSTICRTSNSNRQFSLNRDSVTWIERSFIKLSGTSSDSSQESSHQLGRDNAWATWAGPNRLLYQPRVQFHSQIKLSLNWMRFQALLPWIVQGCRIQMLKNKLKNRRKVFMTQVWDRSRIQNLKIGVKKMMLTLSMSRVPNSFSLSNRRLNLWLKIS